MSRVRRAAIAGGVLITLAYTLLAYSIVSNQRSVCHGRDVTLAVVAGILNDVKMRTDSNPFATKAQRTSSDAFVRYELARIQSAHC